MTRLTILSPLRHRPFRLLFAGQAISDLGDWLSFLALIALMVYRWDLGASALAALSVVLVLPWVFVAPVAGVWVDRWPRRRVMVACDLARAVLVLGFLLVPDVVSLLALVGLTVIFSTFFGPARQAAIRTTVPEEDLMAANSLSQLSVQMGKVLGPAIGGLLVTAAGPGATFVADALSFVASAAFLSQLPALARSEPQGEMEGGSFWVEFRAGLAHILSRRVLTIAVVGMTAAMVIIFIFDGLGALAMKALGFDESLLGIAVGAIGLGSAVGAAAVGQWGNRFNPLGIMGAGNVISGILVSAVGVAVMLGLNGTAVGWIPVWLGVGLAGAAMFVPYGYLLQVETPPEMMGRVSAAATGIQTTFQLLAPPLGAVLATSVGVGAVFGGAGVALALLGVAVLLLRGTAGGTAPAVDCSAEPVRVES